MNREEEYWDLLEAYASNELNIEVRDKVKAWLDQNKDAQTTLLGIRTMMQEVPDQGDRDKFHEDQVEAIISKHALEIEKERKGVNWFWAAAALIVTIVSVAYFFLNSADTLDKKLDVYLSEPYAISDQVRSGTSQETNNWTKAYKTADYGAAIEVLIKIDTLSSIERLYLGLSYLYNDQSGLTINQLKEPFGSPYLDPQRQWYLALAYLKEGQAELSKPILKELKNNKSFKGMEAQELLDLIDN